MAYGDFGHLAFDGILSGAWVVVGYLYRAYNGRMRRMEKKVAAIMMVLYVMSVKMDVNGDVIVAFKEAMRDDG